MIRLFISALILNYITSDLINYLSHNNRNRKLKNLTCSMIFLKSKHLMQQLTLGLQILQFSKTASAPPRSKMPISASLLLMTQLFSSILPWCTTRALRSLEFAFSVMFWISTFWAQQLSRMSLFPVASRTMSVLKPIPGI